MKTRHAESVCDTQHSITGYYCPPPFKDGPLCLHANHLISSSYMSAPTVSLTQHQTQCDRPEEFPYLSQQSIPNVNYIAPPLDLDHLVDYPVSNYLYPHHPSNPTIHDTTGFCTSQHQQFLVSDSSCYRHFDGFFGYYGIVTQHPTLPVPPPSSFSELNNAFVEDSAVEREPQSMSSATLPGLPHLSQPAPKHFNYGEFSQLGLMGMPGISMSNTASNSSYSGSMYPFMDSLTNQGFTSATNITVFFT